MKLLLFGKSYLDNITNENCARLIIVIAIHLLPTDINYEIWFLFHFYMLRFVVQYYIAYLETYYALVY
jgi:hypothetical protein